MAATNFQFKTLENIYYYYNYKLFDGQLPECIITLARHRGANAVYAPDRWIKREQSNEVDEIMMNPETMNRPVRLWHSTLVHEMCHTWQRRFEVYKGAYHDRVWGKKMEEVGLMPSDTGEPGGKKTGYRMTHYIIEGAPFDLAFKEITSEQLNSLELPYIPNPLYTASLPTLPSGVDPTTGTVTTIVRRKTKSGVKIAYSCGCSTVWGKTGLSLDCNSCKQPFAER